MRNRDNRKSDKSPKKPGLLTILLLVALAAALVGIGLLAKSRQMEAERTANETTAATKTEGTSGLPGQLSYNGKFYKLNEDLSNYLLLGIDSTENIDNEQYSGKNGQSDAIYLISYNRRNETIRTLAIPRDTITDIEVFSIDGVSLGTKKEHLNLQYAYGDGKFESCELSRTAVSNLLYGVQIQGYASLNMESLPVLAGLVGGVDVVVPDNSLEEIDPSFKEGATVTLNEENTERFVRYRDTKKTQSALVRQSRQIVFLKAFASKVQELQSQNPNTVTKVYNGLQSYMVTNMGNDLFLKLATAKGIDDVVTLPGEGVATEKYDEYHVDEDALYELIIDMFYEEV